MFAFSGPWSSCWCLCSGADSRPTTPAHSPSVPEIWPHPIISWQRPSIPTCWERSQATTRWRAAAPQLSSSATRQPRWWQRRLLSPFHCTDATSIHQWIIFIIEMSCFLWQVLKILDPISPPENKAEPPFSDSTPSNFLGNKKSIGRFHPYTRYENITFNCCERCSGDILVL